MLLRAAVGCGCLKWRDGNWVRVELTDEGNDSRLAALAVARLG